MEKKEITDKLLDETESKVQNTDNYGAEGELISNCLERFPDNNDVNIIAMKIGLIDVTNSTNLSRYKSNISIDKLAKIIKEIADIDKKIEEGNPSVVSEIAKKAKDINKGKGVNLFSFASKYCCYHNRCVYKKDDYSIYDSVLKDYLPEYSSVLKDSKYSDLTSSKIEKWRRNCDYEAYNDCIGKILEGYKITTAHKRKKLDHFIWFNNRGRKKTIKKQ